MHTVRYTSRYCLVSLTFILIMLVLQFLTSYSIDELPVIGVLFFRGYMYLLYIARYVYK